MSFLLLTLIIQLLLVTVKTEEELPSCALLGTKQFCMNDTAAQISRTTGVLKKNDFPKMSNINYFEFSSNNLTEIDPDFFSNFPNLSKLTIRGNDRFPNITKELLKHCKNLVNLKIYFNYGLHVIEENVLRNFPKLRKLVIRSERIFHFKKHDLDIVTNLRVLKLDLTSLRKIDSNAFEPISNLEKLSLMANNYLRINYDIFRSIPKLKELNLIYADIKDLNFLRYLPKLEILQLAGNKIDNIFADTFKGLRNLRELDLAHTSIKHIDTSSNFFENVPNLGKIDLTCHKLDEELYDIVKFDEHNIIVIDKYATNFDKMRSCDMKE